VLKDPAYHWTEFGSTKAIVGKGQPRKENERKEPNVRKAAKAAPKKREAAQPKGEKAEAAPAKKAASRKKKSSESANETAGKASYSTADSLAATLPGKPTPQTQ